VSSLDTKLLRSISQFLKKSSNFKYIYSNFQLFSTVFFDEHYFFTNKLPFYIDEQHSILINTKTP